MLQDGGSELRRLAIGMVETTVREDENVESALRRFRRMCNQSGLMAELRRRAHYEKPSDVKRREMKKRLRKERTKV